MDTVRIEAEFDLNELQKNIEGALSLEDNKELFKRLASVAEARARLYEAEEALAKVEAEAKGLINAKAKALYGPQWQAIKGPGYKITRSFTGPKYEHIEEAEERFIKVKTTVDAKAVEAYVSEHSELPQGITYNPNRGESIRISLSGVGV